MKAVVVGAGMAGLSALHTLKKAGVDAVCFEKANVPGGRVLSTQRDGFIFDPGAQFFFRSYDTCFKIAEEMGLADQRVSWIFRGGFPHDGSFLPIVASVRPSEMLPNLGETLRFITKAGIPSPAMKQFLGILPMFIKRYKDFELVDFERSLDLDHESLADFVVRMGGKDILEWLFQSVASALTLANPEKLSAAYGMGLFKSMINGLNTYEQGLGSVTKALGEKYSDCIRYGTSVDQIVIEQGKVKGVVVNGALVEADVVIPAVTATKFLQMAPGLPDVYHKALSLVTYSECCPVIFALPFKLFPKDWYALLTPRLTGAMFSGVSDNSVKSKYYAPEGCSQLSCWTYDHFAHDLNDAADDEVGKTLIKELQRFLPAMPDEPLFTEIYRWREAVCIGQPGMLSAMAALKRDHYRDLAGLYLAGEYLNMPSVESAAFSGVYAAQAALHS